MSYAQEIRRLLRLLEDAVAPTQTSLLPQIEKYITMYPQTVADDSQSLIDIMAKNAIETGARFAWAIARLPDGRYIEAPSSKTAQAWGLQIVQQGTDEDFR